MFVYLDASDYLLTRPWTSLTWSTKKSMDVSNSAELIAELRAHNESLRQEVEAWREESRRKDSILMAMAQRIPELEPAKDSSSEPPESPVTASGEPDQGMAASSEQQETSPRRSWWRQFFGLQ